MSSLTAEKSRMEDGGSKIGSTPPQAASPCESDRASSILHPPTSLSERQITLADSDLTLQKWCIENLHALELDPDDEPLSPEKMAGVLSLLRVMFDHARAVDEASGRLWCALIPPQLALKLGTARSTVMVWLKAGKSRRLILDAPDPRHSQRLRHRPAWDVIAPRLHAAAIAGRIPGAPLFSMAVAAEETSRLGAGPAPRHAVSSAGSAETSPIIGPVSAEQQQNQSGNRTGLETSDANFSSFSSFPGRGVRGETPLEGFLPFTPHATGPAIGLVSDAAQQNQSGDRTGSVGRQARRQLLIDFAARATRLEDTATRSEQKLDEIKDGQGVALGVLHEIRTLVGGQAPAKFTNARPRRTAAPKAPRPADRSDELVRRGKEVLRWLETLDAGMREKFITRCRAHLGPSASDWIVNDHLASGIFKTITFAEELAADWRRRICLPVTPRPPASDREEVTP